MISDPILIVLYIILFLFIMNNLSNIILEIKKIDFGKIINDMMIIKLI